MAVLVFEELALRLGLHTLGDDLQAQAGAQGDDGARNGRVVGVAEHVAHEAAVDLELVQRQALEIGQRGVAGAEVVQRESTRLNSSHSQISYAVFCLKKKKKQKRND